MKPLLAMLAVAAAITGPASAQAPAASSLRPAFQAPSADADEDWVVVGVDLAIHLHRRGGAWAGVIDSPANGVTGAPLSELVVTPDRLKFTVGPASFDGVWDPTRQVYVGEFRSGAEGSFTVAFMRGTLTTFGFDSPADPSLAYTPAAAARGRVGPTLPVGKCINLSNTLEAPKEGDWAPPAADNDLEIIKAAGFSTVRIPVRWSAHAAESAPYAIDPAFLARVHHVVDLALAAHLNVILNDHHYEGLDADPESNRERFAALWRQIAESFASTPPSVWFELENEPHAKFTNANLMSVLEPALKAVRVSNPTRPVLIGGENWSGVESLATLPLPDDAYVVPTFHYYLPFAFTDQGQTWEPRAPKLGRGYGSAQDKVLLDHDLASVTAYMARTGRVLVLGEYGASDAPGVPNVQRIRYYHTISSAFASIGVQSCAWGYRSGFKLRDGDHWEPGLVEAIEGTTR